MSMFRILAASALAGLVLAGCTGVGPGFSYAFLQPGSASISPSGQLVITAVPIATTITNAQWSVIEGGGGAVVPFLDNGQFRATYTAPAQPGVYHVHALITVSASGGQQVEAEAVVTVQ